MLAFKSHLSGLVTVGDPICTFSSPTTFISLSAARVALELLAFSYTHGTRSPENWLAQIARLKAWEQAFNHFVSARAPRQAPADLRAVAQLRMLQICLETCLRLFAPPNKAARPEDADEIQ